MPPNSERFASSPRRFGRGSQAVPRLKPMQSPPGPAKWGLDVWDDFRLLTIRYERRSSLTFGIRTRTTTAFWKSLGGGRSIAPRGTRHEPRRERLCGTRSTPCLRLGKRTETRPSNQESPDRQVLNAYGHGSFTTLKSRGQFNQTQGGEGDAKRI